MTAPVQLRCYIVKVRKRPPIRVMARNRSAAKYQAGKTLTPTEPMWTAWQLVESARLAPTA